MQSKESEYYREQLHESLTKYLDSIMNRKAEVLIGDCVGADSMVQEYLARNNYNKVHIYVSGNEVRNNADGIGSLAWKIHNIDASMYEKGTKEWHAIKDEEMSKKATSGLGIILDEGAAATRKNIERLIKANKNVEVYELSKLGKDKDRWITKNKGGH